MKVKRASPLNVPVELNATKARSKSSQSATLSLIKQELCCVSPECSNDGTEGFTLKYDFKNLILASFHGYMVPNSQNMIQMSS